MFPFLLSALTLPFQRLQQSLYSIQISENMLQKLGERGLWKLGVYFLYLCGQVLILGTLMLTTESMLAHSLVMLLTIGLYFAVCLKDPGTYTACPQPNLEDISNHRGKAKEKEKRVVSDRIRDAPQMNDVIREPQQPIPPPKSHKKTSIQQRAGIAVGPGVLQAKSQQKESSLKVPSGHTLQAKTEGNIVASAKNMFSVGMRNVLGNITSLMSRRNLEREGGDGAMEQPQGKSERSIRVEGDGQGQEQGEARYTINVIKSPSQLQREMAQQPPTPSQESSHQQQAPQKQWPLFRPSHHAKPLTIPQRMLQRKRYCRICEFYQPLRVRHCHSCQQCISTFDHHCPWLGTCIGEKNKMAFIGYLFAQTLQFLVMVVDLASYIAKGHQGAAPVGMLLFAVLLIFIVLGLLLGFHVFLAASNLTTWELFRWAKIEYLSIFDKERLRSPFSHGWRENLGVLWRSTIEQEAMKWEEGLPAGLQEYLVKSRAQSRRSLPQSHRKPFLSHANI